MSKKRLKNKKNHTKNLLMKNIPVVSIFLLAESVCGAVFLGLISVRQPSDRDLTGPASTTAPSF